MKIEGYRTWAQRHCMGTGTVSYEHNASCRSPIVTPCHQDIVGRSIMHPSPIRLLCTPGARLLGPLDLLPVAQACHEGEAVLEEVLVVLLLVAGTLEPLALALRHR